MNYFMIFFEIFYKKFIRFNSLKGEILCKINTKIDKKWLKLIYGDRFLEVMDFLLNVSFLIEQFH